MDIKQDLDEYLNGNHSDYYEGYIPISINKYENFHEYKYMSETNSAMRDRILGTIRDLGSFEAQMSWLKQFFSESFLYDYHLVFNDKIMITRKFEIAGEKFSCPTILSPTENIPSDNIYLTRLAQCTTFSAEMKYFLDALGYKNDVVCESQDCFNAVTGQTEKINHMFNVVHLEDNDVVIDISKDIMERDQRILEDQTQK